MTQTQKSTKSVKIRPWTYGQITRFSKEKETIDKTLTRLLVLHQKSMKSTEAVVNSDSETVIQ